jgi:hypothetical protein
MRTLRFFYIYIVCNRGKTRFNAMALTYMFATHFYEIWFIIWKLQQSWKEVVLESMGRDCQWSIKCYLKIISTCTWQIPVLNSEDICGTTQQNIWFSGAFVQTLCKCFTGPFIINLYMYDYHVTCIFWFCLFNSQCTGIVGNVGRKVD